MPSPLGHSLAGYVVSEGAGIRFSSRTVGSLLVVIFLANVPDIDFLPGYLSGRPALYHRTILHSLGFALLTGALVATVFRNRPPGFRRYFLAGAGIYTSHLLLDLAAPDTDGVRGLQLFWPVSEHFFSLSLPLPPQLFELQKSEGSAGFIRSLLVWRNLIVLAAETLVFLPLVVAVKALRQKPPWKRHGKNERQ